MTLYNRIKKYLPIRLKHGIKILVWLWPGKVFYSLKVKCGLAPPKVVPPKLVARYEKTETVFLKPTESSSFAPGRLENEMLTSCLCRQDFFDRPFFQYWYDQFKEEWRRYIREIPCFGQIEIPGDRILYHRKLWEFVYIIQILAERDCLQENKSGLGFAVGLEPLPALFASRGCRIVATDLEMAQADTLGWVQGGQYSRLGLEQLNRSGICPPDRFARQVSFRNVDMNAIPNDLVDFDFCWSSCAFEHLGSIEKGLDFVQKAMDTLKPGGIAVHTTEFNVSSNRPTVDNHPFVLYRKRDIRKLVTLLTDQGHDVEEVDYSLGKGVADRFVDLYPYFRKNMHLKFWADGYVSTSIGLIIRKKN